MPIILTINAGSSSIKYQCFEMVGEVSLAKGQIDRINSSHPKLTYQRHDGISYELELEAQSYQKYFPLICATLTDTRHGIIDDLEVITAVGHRVVHGGHHFSSAALVVPSVEALIEKLSDLAPLHNPFNLQGIRSIASLLNEMPQVAIFDTAFHQTIPPYAHLYPIPYHFYQHHHIRKYGFHGTSHSYVSTRAAEILDCSIESLKIISCHLGSGASVTAIDGGLSVDTSMGITPLAGLMMGTRCGDIDPSLIFQLVSQHNMTIEQVMTLLNDKSGLLGISGVSSDVRDLLNQLSGEQDTPERTLLALNMFCHRVTQYIGQYVATLGGVNVLIFTGGIGENSPRIRSKICEKLGFIGIKVNEQQNRIKGREQSINSQESDVKILVIPTNEELMIARGTLQLLQTIPDPPNPLAEFERLISLVEEKEQTEVKNSIGQPSKLVTTDKSDQKPPQNKQADGEKLVAPHAWLSVYDNKNTDSS